MSRFRLFIHHALHCISSAIKDEVMISLRGRTERTVQVVERAYHDLGQIHSVVSALRLPLTALPQDASIDKLDNVVHSSGRIEPVPPARIFLPLYFRSKLTQRVPHPVPVLESYQRVVHAMLEEDRRVANDVRMVRYTVL